MMPVVVTAAVPKVPKVAEAKPVAIGVRAT